MTNILSINIYDFFLILKQLSTLRNLSCVCKPINLMHKTNNFTLFVNIIQQLQNC